MSILICGSLAFDTIMTFEGRFAEQILPSQLHILNVSFLVPALRREYGGCAGNIAYGLRQLGAHAVPLATLGNDGQEYLARMMGVSRQTINRALKSLSEGGVIVVRYADIELVNIPALMAKAGPVNENLLKSIDGMVQMADRVMAQVERRA